MRLKPLSVSTAFVIGASMAGMMAARALSNHYAKVLILERDPKPKPEADARTTPAKGVPQSDHLHILLDSGLQAIEHYFPGIIQDMLKTEAQTVAMASELHWFQHGAWKIQARNGPVSYTQHRRSLDKHIRARLEQLPNIQFIYDCTVEGVLWDSQGENIAGVNIVQKSGATSQLDADMLIDASGKGSRMLEWLNAAPYEASERGHANPPWNKFPAPPRDLLPINLCYVSRIYQKPTSLPEWKALAISPLPQLPRGGVLMPIDASHWLVTLFGYCGEHPSTSPEAFLEFAKTLAIPDLYNAIAQATPLTEPVKFRYPQSVRQRLDKVQDFPGGVLLIGDAMCSLDPVFGQGMTLACKEAVLLDTLLKSLGNAGSLQNLRKKYFKQARKVINDAWIITEGEVLRFGKMPGKRTLKVRITQWYTGHVFQLCTEHEDIYLDLIDLIHLKCGPERLMRPAILVRVLLHSLAGRFGRSKYPSNISHPE